MKFLCLAYEEEARLNGLTKAEWDALRAETLAYVDTLRKRGCLLAAEPLQSVQTATTVRVREGRVSMTDGPFAETKETLGGLVLIDVPELKDALDVAAHWPSARIGSIEVRPIEDGLPQDRRYGKAEGRRMKAEGRRQKDEGRRQKDEG
jgi:hypothetical protein